ncbi:tetratricopeptide repeat protein [Roseofilum sp. Guam]|uniref:tetratricopeptide repeat protein n=1 Tax=Roseofilum sp. Guam TaxID=2821502 RepID=UPI001B216F6C|nr:tetratricopeptide repeat protein [Roseofilum sp. Guam]MBP0030844.1 tetratricopeptide repeat protein [Roseofilum sp. Guam]
MFNFLRFPKILPMLAGAVALFSVTGIIPEIVRADSSLATGNYQVAQTSTKELDFTQLEEEPELQQLMGDMMKMLAETSYTAGESALEEQDFQGAIDNFNRAIEMYSEYAEAYVGRGVARAQLGDKSGAVSDMQTAASLFQKQGNTEAYQQIQQVLQGR